MSAWRGCGGTGRFPHARQEEGGLTWGKHGFPHGSEPKASDGHSCSSLDRHAVRGSSTSRRLSPRKLNASTTVKMARPGNVPIHHHWKYCVPSATIDPHSAVGGC